MAWTSMSRPTFGRVGVGALPHAVVATTRVIAGTRRDPRRSRTRQTPLEILHGGLDVHIVIVATRHRFLVDHTTICLYSKAHRPAASFSATAGARFISRRPDCVAHALVRAGRQRGLTPSAPHRRIRTSRVRDHNPESHSGGRCPPVRGSELRRHHQAPTSDRCGSEHLMRRRSRIMNVATAHTGPLNPS